MARTIRPKYYRVRTENGATFNVRALSAPAAKQAVVKMVSGRWDVRALHDDDVADLARSGAEIVNAVKEGDR